jgi:hypothetical protein
MARTEALFTGVVGVFELGNSFEFVRLLAGLLALQLLVLFELTPR